MKDKTSNTSLKSKIAAGYLLILLAAGVAIFFLYTGIKNLQSLDKANTKPNVKLFKINQILTLIYEAENQTRSYFLLRNKSDFDSYIQTLDKIGNHIDTLTISCYDNPKQIKHLNTIKALLLQKKDVIQQLRVIKSPSKRNFLYTRALEEVYIQAYELSKISRVVKEKEIITRDTVIEPPKKKGLMKRIFSSSDGDIKSSPRVTVEKKTLTDTVLQEGFSPDTMVKTLQHALDNLRQREDYLQDQSVTRETQLLYNDRMLLDRIREIATLLETEELQTINRVLNQSSSILQNASYVSMLLAAIAIFVIVVFLILIFRDISLGKKRQLALQAATRHAEELMKLKEQFLANMSHEIRTPLGTIIGFTEQLHKTKLETQQEQYVETIDKASAHLLDLVNDILDLSKIEAGRFTLEKVCFNLNDLIKEVCHSFSLKASQKNLQTSCTISPELDRELIGDPFRIRQVLINIVGNALKFTDEGSVSIEASIETQNDNTIFARIAVSDSGIGIEPEKQEEIFEYFSQADSGTSRKYGGTGLGLAISKRIVELHDGKISLQSNPGVGSTFIIEIPLDLPKQSENSTVINTSPTYQQFSIENIADCLKGRHILVIDDDETTLMLIESLLKKIELETEILTDSSKVIEALEQKHIDLVITDIHMPGLSGIELLKNIRNHTNEQIRQLPVLASTANATDKNEIILSGFTDYLSKPFKENVFYQKIGNVLCPENLTMIEAIDDMKSQMKPDQPFSFDEVSNFTGNDQEALQLVVKTFVEKSLQTIQEMQNFVNERNTEEVSFRAHRLIPTFRQFQINSQIDNLLKLERYTEMNLPNEEFFDFANSFIESAVPILHQINNSIR